MRIIIKFLSGQGGAKGRDPLWLGLSATVKIEVISWGGDHASAGQEVQLRQEVVGHTRVSRKRRSSGSGCVAAGTKPDESDDPLINFLSAFPL